MKLKRLTVAGREYKLAPLTLTQVETLIDPETPERERAWLPICNALANSGQSVDIASLKGSLDYEDYERLHDAVLELSALKHRKKEVIFDPEEAQSDKPLDFSYLRARLAAHMHVTFTAADEQPFPDIIRLFEYWQECPPVDQTFASFVGYKPRVRMRDYEGGEDSTRAEKANLVGQWGGQVVQGADNLPLFLQDALVKDGLLKFG